MLESERERLTKLDQELARRVIGQEEAVQRRRERRASLARRACRIRIVRSARSSSSARPASERRRRRARSPSSCSTTSTRWCASTCRSTWRSTPSRGSSARRRATSATRKADSSPRRCVVARTRSILFDEIEKAHPDVFNILLQILDDGRLTDSQGRTVDFRNTVIIMTSNIGSTFILEHARGDWALVETQVMAALRQHFKPEFLNRVDDIIIFRPLGTEQIEKIVDLQLKRFEKLLADRKITLEVTPEAKRVLAEEGYDPAFGARPLKRSIQRMIQNPLAMAVLEGKFSDGDAIVVRPDGKGGLRVLERAGAGDRGGVRRVP